MITMWAKLKKKENLLLLLPALFAFIIALIPTLSYKWPLSWDIIYHVQYAQVYAHYGFTLTNPLLNAPLGQKIGYPPLFHFLILILGYLFNLDYLQLSRFLQPFLFLFIVLSVSYIARKLYGTLAGMCSGFMVLSSYLVHRLILPLPENLALIFLPLAVYLYYQSIHDDNWKYGLIAGITFLVVVLTHHAAALCLFLIVTSYSLVEFMRNHKLRVLKSYGLFLSSLMVLIGVVILFLWIFLPDMFYNLFQSGITAVTGLSTSVEYNKPAGILTYLGALGPMVLFFAFMGSFFSFKNLKNRDILIFTWIVSMFLLSISYLCGINVISYRVLVYMLLPLAILAGWGLCQVYSHLRDFQNFSSPRFRGTFLVCMLMLCLFFSILTVENPRIAVFKANNEFGGLQIAPPSPEEEELVYWFQENGDKNKSLVIANQFTGMLIVTTTGVPMHYGFEFFSTKNATKSDFTQEGIGYVIYDKRLVIPDQNPEIRVIKVAGEFYPLFYFNKDIKSNIAFIMPDSAHIVYENDYFIVCQIET